ncbi:aquaporin-11-like [Paramacrobiotus metropolitanus]|uniref:aquaporin-11-like n=1 Tax=Paramacrobiotus metropolitanus TaxID=2943436 RepID=UPI0024457F6E|nr:aquaporin-11-like [Paramacrobiotus metropolitanus]
MDEVIPNSEDFDILPELESSAAETTTAAVPGFIPLGASIAHFAFIILYCQIARFLSNRLITSPLYRIAVEEFICTVQLCASNFELGVVTEVYGFSGYALGLFFTSMSYSLTFEDGTADPTECLDKWLKRQIGVSECVLRSALSIGGAAVSYKAAKMFWAFRLIPEHANSFEGAVLCTASLQVSLLLGIIFEGGETFVNRLMQASDGFNMLSGGLSDVAITFCGLFVTGGYFNPSLSFAMEFGCQGITGSDFFMIYWVGPAIATLIAFQTAPAILRAIQGEPRSTETQVKDHKD